MGVHLDKTGELAFVTIDNPPVNASSQTVRAGLMTAIAETEADDSVTAVVLRGAGKTFTAGADVTEFDKLAVEPHLPDVILALEKATKPWIAALHGTVLGGGLEIALGCHYRVAHQRTKLGLPEVTLGLIPGAGGTVRLPRLIDPAEALAMISSGRPIDARKAAKLGLIDDVAEGDATETAIALARKIADDPLPVPVSDRPPSPIANPDAWENARGGILTKAGGALAPQAAVAAIQRAIDSSANTALQAERDAFLSLKSGPQCAALRYLFFTERSAAKLPVLRGVTPNPLDHIGVVGGGTMGAGIAAACLLRGLHVTMIEQDKDAATAGHDRVSSILADSHKRGTINKGQLEAMSAVFQTSTDFVALSGADLVVEAVFEDMDVKRDVVTALDVVLRKDAIIASNTSYLDINVLAQYSAHPSRVIGLHFFSPAYIMKLVEVIVTDSASPTALATSFSLAKRLGKIAVPSGVCDGFIGNRIMSAYRRTCEIMVEDGALPWDIDSAMRNFGFPMGLFEMQDLAGLDISWAMRKRKAATRNPSERYVDLGDKLCEAGRFGRKSQGGWYDYGSGRATKSDWVEALVMAEARRKGITRVPFSAQAIMDRILGTMRQEATDILAEGIAKRAEDIDVVMANGYGFPRWRGGPMFMSDELA